ncbi:MAG: PilZ domain-containing protein [Lachnospiraceae bacterium]|nr:PilZ domain-containing protein [Lachnospiraceae bacterium]
MNEKRAAKRMEINVSIRLGALREGANEKEYYDVELVNLSRKGVAFKCRQTLDIDRYYDTQIVIWTKEKIDTVIRVVRVEGDMYGAEFVGLSSEDDTKISIYELVNYSDK